MIRTPIKIAITFLAIWVSIGLNFLDIAKADDGLVPIQGSCSKIYGSGHDYGIASDNSSAGMYLENDTCVPTEFKISSIQLTPSKLELKGKPQIVSIRLEMNSNSSNLNVEIADIYLRIAGQTESLIAHGGLCGNGGLGSPGSLIINPKTANKPDSEGKIVFDMKIKVLESCPTGNYQLTIVSNHSYPGDWGGLGVTFELDSLRGNSIAVVNRMQIPKLGGNCSASGKLIYDASSEPIVCSKVAGKLVWKSKSNTESPSPKQSKMPESISAGQVCPSAGLVKKSGGSSFVCAVVSKKKIWVKTSSSKETTGNSSNESPAPKISRADLAAQAGCSTFPDAIVQFEKAVGQQYGPALIAVQKAAANIQLAKSLDGKYAPLDNAQYRIIQYAQAVGWSGRGYFGDANTVRTAIATFNATCGSSIYIP